MIRLALQIVLCIVTAKGEYSYYGHEYPYEPTNGLVVTSPKWKSTSRVLREFLGDELVERQIFGIPFGIILAIASVSTIRNNY